MVKSNIQAWWSALAARERAFLWFAVITAMLVGVYVGLWQPLLKEKVKLLADVEKDMHRLVRIQTMAAQFEGGGGKTEALDVSAIAKQLSVSIVRRPGSKDGELVLTVQKIPMTKIYRLLDSITLAGASIIMSDIRTLSSGEASVVLTISR